MTVPLRKTSPEWTQDAAHPASHRTPSLSASARRESALSAVTAALAAASLAHEPHPDAAGMEFVEQLVSSLRCSMTVYQKELLADAFTKAVDARVQSYLRAL